MAYEFLNETTYDNDALADGSLLATIGSMQQQEEEEYDEPVDEDLIAIGSYVADDEETESQEEAPEQEESDEDESDGMMSPEIMDYLFSVSQDAKPVEGSPYTNVGNAVNLPNVPTSLDWLNTKSNNVNLGGINQNISKYLNTLPQNLREALVATSGNDATHAKGSKHYNNNAVDLRYNDQVYNYMMSDPVFKKLGLRILPPNHGTAKHLHVESYKYGGYILDSLSK